MTWASILEVVGWLLTAIGAAMLVLALIGDRARGRVRCPKCWYDMAGQVAASAQPPWTCPECGRAIRSARRLHRRRIRTRLAILGLLMCVLGHAAGATPSVIKRGWWAALPRTSLMLLTPWTESLPRPTRGTQGAHGVIEELWAQVVAEDEWSLRFMWPGERALLRACIRPCLSGKSDPNVMERAARLYAMAGGTVESAGDAEAQGRAAMALMLHTYAHATTYQDEGLVEGSIWTQQGGRDDKPFVTYFERGPSAGAGAGAGTPGRLRFEYVDLTYAPSQQQRYVVWNDGTAPKSWWTVQPAVVNHPSTEMSLAGPTGVSGGAAANVPYPLLRRGWLGRYSGAVVLGETTVDGHRCWRVESGRSSGRAEEWLIDEESHLLRAIRKSGSFPSITTYRPRLNEPIDPSVFSFDPLNPNATPLGDGEGVCKRLRGLAGPMPPGTAPRGE